VYQVAWQRILALQSGVGIYSVAAIVAAFMLGLGAGSHGGGTLSVRLSPRAALLGFALVELGIGAFGAASGWLYYDVLFTHASWLYTPVWRAALVHLAVLLPPTFLMGMSLPLLARATVVDTRTAGRTLGLLYGINLLGAALGALLAPWWFIRFYGIRGATFAAAALNLFAGVAGLVAGARAGRQWPVPPAAGVVNAASSTDTRTFRTWILLYALSGFCALSLEVVWFRLLDVALKSNAFTFGTLLCVYLFGSAMGCLAIALRADRVRRPLPAFLALQCALIAYAAFVVVLLAWLPPATPLLRWYHEYWAGFLHVRVFDRATLKGTVLLYAVLPAILFGLPTFLMGASFPLLQRAVQDDPATAGRKVGLLQAANIAGCVAGSLIIGLVVLGHIGTAGALRIILAGGLVFAVLGLRVGSRPRFVAAAAAMVILAAAVPGGGRLWMRLLGRVEGQGVVNEDATGVAAVAEMASGGHGVFVNGKHHSQIPFGGTHTRLGAAPAIVHPNPLDVAIIGLGSGDTAWASGCRPETRHMTVFEISGGQPGLLAAFVARTQYAPMRSLLSDPRLRIVVDDGRRALQSSDARYDVIEADALWPMVAYAGNLYSEEFFTMCASRLKPGGLLCTWAPTPRVYSTFVTVMPHVIGLGDRQILIGSMEPLEVDLLAWRARLRSAEVRAYLGEDGAAHTDWLLERLRPLHLSGRLQPEQTRNRDLFPRDEFASPP
jgi:predicted membrane-bound spermidine synthase